MGENEKGIESPIELLRQLIEESGKWTEEIVTFARQQIIVFLIVIFQTVSVISYVFYNISKDPDPVPLPSIVAIAIVLIFLILVVSNAIVKLRRKYRSRIARRDRWREKFEVLKKKEEEIEKLLSEEAG